MCACVPKASAMPASSDGHGRGALKAVVGIPTTEYDMRRQAPTRRLLPQFVIEAGKLKAVELDNCFADRSNSLDFARKLSRCHPDQTTGPASVFRCRSRQTSIWCRQQRKENRCD